MTGYLNKVECGSQLDIVGFQKKKIIGFWCSWVVAIWLLSHCCCLGSLVLLLSLLALLFGPFVLLLVGSFYIVVVVVGQLFLYCCCLGPFAFWPDFSCWCLSPLALLFQNKQLLLLLKFFGVVVQQWTTSFIVWVFLHYCSTMYISFATWDSLHCFSLPLLLFGSSKLRYLFWFNFQVYCFVPFVLLLNSSYYCLAPFVVAY